MTGRLSGKKIFTTAAGQGIGRAVALAFAKEGAHVIATDLDEAKLEGLQDGGVAETAALNVLDKAAVDAMAAKVGSSDVLFNCAGFVHHGTILDSTDDEWDFAFNLNVKAMHWVTKAFLPGMIDNGGGSIVNVASVVSSLKAAPNRYIYGASKSAILGMTRSIALDFIGQGIRANAICPATVQSPSLDDRIADLGKDVGGYEAAKKMFIDRQPMGRIGTVDEIAALATYLASDESGFVTGGMHVIDGGMGL